MMIHELVTLACAPLELDAVSTAALAWVSGRGGRLLGAWRSEIGVLFELKLLLAFDTPELLREARRETLSDTQPFGIADASIKLTMETYEPFDFLPTVKSAELGRFYEFRTYHLKPGGVTPTREAWRDAVGPARDYTRHLITNMVALDGPPRITHIWGFASLEERMALRARHYAEHLWPPKGGPQQIAHATSTICIPEPYSPLR